MQSYEILGELRYLCDCAVLAYQDTFIAADAGGSIFDFDMTMPKEINLAEHLFGTSVEAVPAGCAIARIEGDICRRMAVA